ncbi:cobalt ECF transporter T component CbiQ [Nostoc sp. FACHB-110]|uniref:cobalt ECF transporter T component CbiQ n=1 Tax=Nostoc sp. FACHB-110 TaxID=2692834 RepID=UPI0016882E88|nr:cobalt ECF transporter T component CbiQ [Nostoc sp. FACHB-110]MBD2436956.1 cobalt ECF transporter T component CbiQ [Nostoc sp. FACHB-110]
MSLQIDTLAYTNQLRKIPPEHKIIFAIATLVISLATHPLVQIFIALWMGIWIVIYAKIPFGFYFKLLILASFFWLTSLPALMLNSVPVMAVPQVLTDAWTGVTIGHYYIYISRNGSEQVLAIFTRALASVSCLYFLMLTVPFTEILQTLRRFGFPILLTELLLLMYRFIFILLRTATELWTAQQSRNGYRTWRIGMKSLSLLIGQLLKRTLQQYHQFYLALEARGFNDEFRVVHSRHYHPKARYLIEVILGYTVLIALEFGQNAGIFTRISASILSIFRLSRIYHQ